MAEFIEHRCEIFAECVGEGPFSIEVKKLDGRWFLAYASYATEDDVAVGQASYLGEKLTSLSVLIRYCPYCGAKLASDELPHL